MYVLKYYEPHYTGKLYLMVNNLVYDSIVLDKQQLRECLAAELKQYDISKCDCRDVEFKAAQSMVKYITVKYAYAKHILPDISKWQQPPLT